MSQEIRQLRPTELQTILDDPMSLELRDDLHEVIPALAPTSFVTVARQLLREQRLDLIVPHASPAQLRAVVDFDGWRQDRLDPHGSRGWLTRITATLVEGQAPRGTLSRLVHDMDVELWVLVLMATTAVAEAEPDDDEWKDRATQTMESLATYESPDGNYLVGVPDDEFGRQALAILDAIYQDDLATGAKVVRFIKYSLGAELEEEQLRWRAGRLADEGFPSWEDAMRLLVPMPRREAVGVPVDTATGTRGQVESDDDRDPPSAEATASLSPTSGEPLLGSVLEGLDTHARGVRGREFLLLVNELMAAQRFEPGDPERQRHAIAQAQATINLGLELLAVDHDEDARLTFLRERLAAIGMRGLFRVGLAPLQQLHQACAALHRSGHVSLSHPGSLLDRPWGPWITGLIERIPRMPVASTTPASPPPSTPFTEGPARPRPPSHRPMASRLDVALATRALAQAGVLARLVFDGQGFGVDPSWVSRVDEPQRLRLGDLIRTALVHERLPGSAGQLAPLTADDLSWARAHLLDARGRLHPEVDDSLRTRLARLGASDHADDIVTPLLTRLAVELAGLEEGPDGRVSLARVGGLLTIQQVGMWLKTGVQDGNVS